MGAASGYDVSSLALVCFGILKAKHALKMQNKSDLASTHDTPGSTRLWTRTQLTALNLEIAFLPNQPQSKMKISSLLIPKMICSLSPLPCLQLLPSKYL